MPNFKGNSGGGPTVMKMYGKGKNPIMMTAAQETLPEILKTGIRAKEEKDSGLKMYDKASPNKTKLGRLLMGRKKETLADGTEVVTDKRGGVVKTKKDGVKTKYKKGSRPSAHQHDPNSAYRKNRGY